MNEIFISYRRNDSADVTGRIRHDLANAFGSKRVFNDVYSVQKGQNFRDAIFEAIDKSKVYLVVIGPRWLEKSQYSDRARLEDKDDNVRVELEAALAKEGLVIIPLLVSGASMPRSDDLPESLKDLSYLNGMSIRTGRDYDRDIRELESVIAQLGVLKVSSISARSNLIKRAAFFVSAALLAALALQFPQFTEWFGGGSRSYTQEAVGDAATDIEQSTARTSIDLEDAAGYELPFVSAEQIRRVQTLLNRLRFSAGIPDGQLGPTTQRSIRAFQRVYGVAVTGEPSTLLETHLNEASSIGFSNVMCETRQSTEIECRNVTRTRRVPRTETVEHELDARLPCYYNINMFCNFSGCNWPAIESMCEQNNSGRAQLLQQCKSSYAGSLDDYDIYCNCGPSYCGCDTSAMCSVQQQTTKLEYYTERVCEPKIVTQEVCTCRAPEVCPDSLE